MTDKTTTKYLVHWDDGDDQPPRGEIFPDLASARKRASGLASMHPGQEFHVSAHVVTFRAETVVKEV